MQSSPTYEQLWAENRRLSAENVELRAALDLVQKKFLEIADSLVEMTRRHEEETTQLKTRVLELETELLKSQRAGKRQAAPFRRRKRIPKSQQKKPGRPKGHTGSYREPPKQQDLAETTEVPAGNCPKCGGEPSRVEPRVHHVVDIPPIEPIFRRIVTHCGCCDHCRCQWTSDHPDLPSQATGAAGTMLGHRACALATQMRTQLGATYGKMAAFFAEALGIRITPAGVLGVVERAKKALVPAHDAIREHLRQSETVHADETGWRLDSESAWAWVFANRQFTCYVISRSRGHGVVLDVLGSEFGGCLLSDFFSAYDPLPYESKSKCLAHLLRALSDVEELQTRGAVKFPRWTKSLLRDAVELKGAKGRLGPEEYADRCAKLEKRLDRLLAGNIREPKNLRLANRMRKHREHLLTFLYHDSVDPTNNLAERQIRPFVLQRKISAGNRSARGAQIHTVLASVMATCHQQARNFTELVMESLRFPGHLPEWLRLH